MSYLGRKDFQHKIHGQRVDTAEVENALLELTGIREAVVQTVKRRVDAPRLIAYLVPAGVRMPTVSAIRRHLAIKLPAYMIPGAFVTLDRLPLTDNGKVDRTALPQPAGVRPELDNDYVAPQTDKEALLSGIWANVLELDQVGVQDNLFDLGGDSLSVATIVGHLREMGIALTMVQMFEHPTIRALVTYLEPRAPRYDSFDDVMERAKQQRTAFARQRLNSRWRERGM